MGLDTIQIECPKCRHVSPLATPSVGDWLICTACGQLGVYSGDGVARKPDVDELTVMLASPPVQMIRRAIVARIASRN